MMMMMMMMMMMEDFGGGKSKMIRRTVFRDPSMHGYPSTSTMTPKCRLPMREIALLPHQIDHGHRSCWRREHGQHQTPTPYVPRGEMNAFMSASGT